METRDPPRRTATMDEPDDMTREPLLSGPRPMGEGQPPKALILSALAIMLVVALVVTTAAVLQGLRSHSTGSATAPTATATAVPTVITVPIDPKASGWTALSPVVWGGDVKFAASSPQRGYLCGQAPQYTAIGVTTDGGQHWQLAQSPAQFSNCALQVSPTNPLDLTLTSGVGGSFGGDSPASTVDAHYSTNGGKTWRSAPIPTNTHFTAGAMWSGTYLYVWTAQYDPQGGYPAQKSSLAVSANGGSFTSIDTTKLLPGAQKLGIVSVVATADKLYVNLSSQQCGSLATCAAVVSAVVASSDGGKTWTQVPNQSNIQLVDVFGDTLYGQAPDPQNPKSHIEITSTDNGATWTQLKLPPVPGLRFGAPTPFAFPAPDGTLFAAPDGVGIVYMSNGKWTLIPFSAYGEYIGVAFALDSSGKPATVWAIDDGNDSFANIYSHPLP